MSGYFNQFDPLSITRRQLLTRSVAGVGSAALAALLRAETASTPIAPASKQSAPAPSPNEMLAQFAPRAKRVIYLFQEGAPSQLELFDYKPGLAARQGQELPDTVRMGQRITGMTSIQNSLPLVASRFGFSQHGQSGMWLSELLPHTAKIADKICLVRSMHTEAINHDPAMTFFQTGSQIPGRPSIGSWLSYGLGSANHELPAFVVLVSIGTAGNPGQPLSPRLWGSGFLPAEHQGVRFRSTGDSVLYLANPAGVSSVAQRQSLDAIEAMNRMQLDTTQDPEIAARIKNYELAFRMQTSVPELLEAKDEPDHVFDLYGAASRQRGAFAANCLMARRLVERGVRFVQLYHTKWDHHAYLPDDIRKQSADTDQASAALILDLERRGLLDDTLVVWGGEFGRTVYCQGTINGGNYGRDHHPRCFSIWMAGGGVKPGLTYGETDDFSYNIIDKENRGVHVHDLQATILHLLGVDHTKLTFRSQGRDFRLTDVAGNVKTDLLA